MTLEQQTSDYLALRSGPVRPERIADHLLKRAWPALSLDEKATILSGLRRAGWIQQTYPWWIRRAPRIDLTESAFGELVTYASGFAEHHGRSPACLRELCGHLREVAGADDATIDGLHGLAEDPAYEAALACATFVSSSS